MGTETEGNGETDLDGIEPRSGEVRKCGKNGREGKTGEERREKGRKDEVLLNFSSVSL